MNIAIADSGDHKKRNIYEENSGHELRVMRYRLMDRVYSMLQRIIK